MKKNTRENRKRRKLFLAILMILFTGLILTSSAYAWFTANEKVKVDTIDVNVAASNGLQISSDGTSWKTLVDKAEITAADAKYSTNTNQLAWSGNGVLAPVSTIGESADGKLKMFFGTVKADNLGTFKLSAVASPEQKGTTGHFVAFDLFFKVDAQSQINLTGDSKVTAKGDDKGLQNAARVAWFVEGNHANPNELAQIQALKATSTTNDNLIIWEPNNDQHTDSARAHANSNYGKNPIAVPDVIKGVKAPIPEGSAVVLNSQDAQYFGDLLGKKIDTTKDNTEAKTWFNLDAGVTKVRFYLWIEGQDVDCENSASGSEINYNMGFEIAH